ncbi:MAG: amidohydrolase family protein [Nocardioidaceae bacterium]
MDAGTDGTGLTVSGIVLPERERRDLHVRDGRVSAAPVDGARDLGTGWIVPGLVDAHCHIGLDESGGVDEATQTEQAVTDRDAGALLLRDCGTVADTRWIDERDDLPRIVRCGRHIARTRRYTRGFAHEIEPELFVTQVQQEARRGAWVKIVADWIDRGEGDLMPVWPRGILRDGIAAAHDLGAKVTAHVFGEAALPDLLDARVDCIEHGTGLSDELIAQMVDQGTAFVPTTLQLNNFDGFAAAADGKFPAYAAHMRELYARRVDTVRAAYLAGVPVYAGTDAGGVRPHGTVADEINELHAYGLLPFDALGAGSWRAREWLGFDGSLTDGAEADFVVYDADPLEDLTVLRRPRAVVLRGRPYGN